MVGVWWGFEAMLKDLKSSREFYGILEFPSSISLVCCGFPHLLDKAPKDHQTLYIAAADQALHGNL